jgi:hypothetical protein
VNRPVGVPSTGLVRLTLGRRRGRGELDEGQRIAPGLPADPVAQRRPHRRRSRREQRDGGRFVEPRQPDQRHPVIVAERKGVIASGGQDDDLLAGDPPGDERQRVDRRLVHPMQVVEADEHRRLGGAVGQHLQDGEAGEERIDLGRLAHAEAREQGVPLPRRQPVGAREERAQQLVQSGERQLRLGLASLRGEHGEAQRPRVLRRPLLQGALADAGLAEQPDDASAVVGRVELVGQEPQLLVAPDEGRPRGWLHQGSILAAMPRRPAAGERPEQVSLHDDPAAARTTNCVSLSTRHAREQLMVASGSWLARPVVRPSRPGRGRRSASRRLEPAPHPHRRADA